MSFWSKLFNRRGKGADATLAAPDKQSTVPESKAIPLPDEPFVFECQSCGKVFEARRKRAACPECDSSDVSLMSE